MFLESLKVGDRVEWTSQSRGVVQTKVGSVIRVIPAGEDPAGVIKNLRVVHGARAAYGRGGPRGVASYLILVPRVTPKSKPVIYWPRVNLLMLFRGAPAIKESA
jgi:hypothetical protein